MATENNNKNLNVPNLRFPEFSGEWTKTTLGKIGETFNGLTGKSGSDFGQGSPYITYKSIFDNSKIDLSRVEYVTITDAERKKQTQNEVQYGDIFFTTSSETPDEVGMTSVLLDEVKDCYLNSFCFGYRLNSITDVLPEYMRFYLRSNTIRRRLFVLAQGSTRFNISKGEVMGLTIKLPGTAEQRKIAQLLTMIEDRIATQIKIIEDLKKLKSAISNEIFEHTSNRKCELKEIASVIMGQSPSSHAYNNNADGLPLIQGNLDIENGQLSPRIYTSEITQTCECGDVILTVRAPVGEIAIAQQEACIGRGVCSIRPHVKNDTNLIYQFLQYFKPKWGSLEQGSTFTAVSGTDIRGIAVSIPSTDKIKLLNVYDNKIRVESRILTNLIQQKQYLLAQMFI